MYYKIDVALLSPLLLLIFFKEMFKRIKFISQNSIHWELYRTFININSNIINDEKGWLVNDDR